MRKNSFVGDNIGQAFTLDVMLALVIITTILGISADAIDIASYKSTDYSSRFSLERVTTDAADMLIKTPGSPDDWEFGISNSTTPGLALIDSKTGDVIPNTLSVKKIITLKNNYNSMIYGKVLPLGVNSSMMIYPSNSSLSPIEIMKNNPKNAAEVAVANRTVTIDSLDVKTVIYNNTHKKASSEEICPNPDHSTESNGNSKWACNYFNISLSELNSTDFYIITDPANIGDNSPSWILNRPEKGVNNENGEKFNSTPININEKILNLLGNDTKGVLWLHVRTPGNKDRNFDAYIVSVPKGTNQTQVSANNLNPEPWFFVLQVWY
jgi:hypothetical protein